MMETICSSDTSVLTTATRRHIPEDGILRSHRRGNLKSYTFHIHWVDKQKELPLGPTKLLRECSEP
jgi:hypothetical protein